MVSIRVIHLYNGDADMEYKIDNLVSKLKNADAILLRQQQIIEELRSENDLLTSTILNNEIGKIAEERRQLRKEIRESKDNERRASVELQNYKAEYDNKYDELVVRLQDVKAKQTNIDDYIVSEAAEMIKEEQKSLEEQYSVRVQTLKDKYTAKAEQLSRKLHSVIVLCVL